MEIMRTSPRVLKATNKYIASLGRKREDLTEEQWNLMLKYIKARRIGMPFLLFFALLSIFFAYKYWQLSNKYLTKVILNPRIEASSNQQDESILMKTEEIRYHFKRFAYFRAMAWGQFLIANMMLTFFIISLTIVKITNRKTHRTLLSRPPATGVVV